jgi:hypothetical protein
MGNIKDIIDLTTQLANSVKDRKIASDLNDIQQLILALQSEQADLHEKNIKLREDKLDLNDRIQKLEKEIVILKTSKPQGPPDVPTCPNCSTGSKLVYMSPLPSQFVRITGSKYQCTACKYRGD